VSDDGAAIRTDGLRREFEGRAALAGVSMEVRAGEVFGLVGPNGGGKTTLFRILATLLRPDGGSARVMGHDVVAEEDAVRASIGIVFQMPSLDRFLSVEENLHHQGHLYGLRGAPLAARAAACLALVGLADRRHDRVGALSGGLRRRVEIAKGLLHEPPCLLLDEPTTGLDPGARREVWDHLAALRERGVTSVVATHLLEEAERCDRIAILDRGRLVAAGTPEELRASVGGAVVTAVPRFPARLEALRSSVAACFKVEARAVGGAVRVETKDGASLAHDLLRGFERDLATVTVGRPTLEDVFLRATGRHLG
jgi:ABC-2 type transport system ATP-binding protein